MADHKYKSKSSRNVQEEEKKKLKKSKYKDDSKVYYLESKTPPLPTSSSSIEDLIKKRESLRKELKKITSCPEGDLNSKDENEFNHSKKIRPQVKRKYSKDRSSHVMNKEEISISSPDHNDSDDEEHIIEQRRKQRKKLLEKFRTFDDNRQESNKIIELRNIKTQNQTILISDIKPAVKDVPDMFSEKDEFGSNNLPDQVKQDNDSNTQLTDNWDNSDGYYNTKIGDIMDNRYTIKCNLGQGVFANVVRAQDSKNNNSEVAIKIIRNNEMMHKIGLKEMSVLKQISEIDPENKYHCVKFMTHFKHKGHLCLVIESMYMDLRGVIKKYGRHGLNMKALMSYSRQLLLALRLLKKIGIIHADVKPDNILINEKKNVLKLCDFGSSTRVTDNDPTPYLVSRFYRAPEIILGISYKHGVDIWSAGCTIFEMASGKILFTGSSNNKMLKSFMDFKGKIPNKILRKGIFKDQHFNYNNHFLLHKKDEATGREKVVEISNISATKDLYTELKKACKNVTTCEDKKLFQLKDLLDKIFVFDANHRLPVVECLKHPFIQEEIQH